jgi:NAD(P)H-hydrate epimerase
MNIILTRDQIRSVDHAAINDYGIPGPVLMENAGRNAAAIIRETYGENGSVFICCGPGNNGGDGCVIARHLHNAGWSVRLLVTNDETHMTDDMKTNFRIVKAMGLEPQVEPDGNAQLAMIETLRSDEVVVDALLGTGFRGEVRSPTAELIAALNAADKRGVVAIDVPSGLDCNSGAPSNATINADLTITFVARKTGLVAPTGRPHVGRIEVVDIGVPRELVAKIAGS